MNFAYEKPRTTDAVAALLSEAGSNAAVLAGGTDLLVALRARLIAPQLVIDIKGVEELLQYEHHSDGSTTIGAAITANRLFDDARLGASLRGLRHACGSIATYAIRNRATIVGNVANASPCADTVPPLCVLDARLELQSKRGTRELTLPEFIQGVRSTTRTRDEFVARLRIPPQTPGTRVLFAKRQRVKGHDLALVNASLLHDPERKRLRLAVGSCAPAPVVIELDDLFATLDAEEAARRAMGAIRPISDVRASAEYRIDMTGVLVRRLFNELGA